VTLLGGIVGITTKSKEIIGSAPATQDVPKGPMIVVMLFIFALGVYFTWLNIRLYRLLGKTQAKVLAGELQAGTAVM
jgi:hypothetical protein